MSKWMIHGSRTLYRSPWVELDLVEVEPEGHARYEHHLVKFAPVAATVLLNSDDEVLLMWRHRFATDTWSWEIPSGIVEAGEPLEYAAAREVLEETGYQIDAGSLEPLAYNQPIGGMSNAEHHVFLARHAVKVTEPVDDHEADRIEWHPLADVQRLIDERLIVAGARSLVCCNCWCGVGSGSESGTPGVLDDLAQVLDSTGSGGPGGSG